MTDPIEPIMPDLSAARHVSRLVPWETYDVWYVSHAQGYEYSLYFSDDPTFISAARCVVSVHNNLDSYLGIVF